MDGFETRYELSMRATLVEFASYDASLLVCAFLRRALLFVYADAGALVFRPHMQRRLALRLLSRSASISEKFMWSRLDDFRNPATSFNLAECSDHVLHLGKRAQAASRTEAAALARLMRREDTLFDLKASPFDAIRYAWSLELALQKTVGLSPTEHDVVFRSWSDAFSHVLRGTYLRYIEVLSAWPEMMLQTHQDFVDTWPTSLEALASTAPANNSPNGSDTPSPQMVANTFHKAGNGSLNG